MNSKQLTRLATGLWPAALGVTLLSGSSSAQFNDQWVSFTKDNTKMQSTPGLGLSDPEEKDYTWGDVDQDGWVDLICVRKQPFTSTGHFPNVLFMNEGGTLVDKTTQYASASDVAGDQGFLTPTNDRDVVLFDANNDGWLDMITATTLSIGTSKAVSHPRVYMNLGNDGSGNWLGFRHEDARIPQLLLSNGSPSFPKFCSVAAGDVTGDGFDDLYFGDYDSGSSTGGDMNDRLLINDGTGHFIDESTLRMTSGMLASNFGNSVAIEDFNVDGKNDILKGTSLSSPTLVKISYNDPNSVGVFNIFDDFQLGAPYHTNTGDLNNDGRVDVVVSDDGADRYRINTGTDVFGRATWGNNNSFEFVTGGDDGFASNNLIADLDDDGWNDILICDVDVDIGGCGRRAHIYHNRGGVVGGNPVLREEAGSGGGGWRGVVGITAGDLVGSHDVAVFDLDNDGDNDMVLGRCNGTDIWLNDLYEVNPAIVSYCDCTGTAVCGNNGGAGEGCANSAGHGAKISGLGSVSVAADSLQVQATGLLPNQPALLFQGTTSLNGGNGVAFGDGLRCAGGQVVRLGVGFPDTFGDAIWGPNLGSTGNWNAGDVIRFQVWYRDPAGGPCASGFNLSNGLEVTFTP
jgi:hypothetical protein